MVKRVTAVLFLVIFIFSLSGCATARKQKDMEIQGLKNQISVLEAQVQSKDEEINSLRDAFAKANEEKQAAVSTVSKRKIGEVKSRPNTRQIQIALSNAGYNPGRIDAKLGRQTVEAVKAFQKANKLAADGRVGKKTWDLLRDYLDKKIK